jgi:hypothetical protein
MQNFSFKKLIFNTYLLSLSLSAFGQNEELSTEELMAVFNMRFDIAAPDTTFVETEQGWAEEATRAQIVCTALPASFERVMEDFKEFSLPEGMVLISKNSMKINDIEGFLVVTEAAPPAEEPNQEHFYAIMYMRPWEKNVTLNINAVYPKSQHDRLYQKMLATFATVRKKED